MAFFNPMDGKINPFGIDIGKYFGYKPQSSYVPAAGFQSTQPNQSFEPNMSTPAGPGREINGTAYTNTNTSYPAGSTNIYEQSKTPSGSLETASKSYSSDQVSNSTREQRASDPALLAAYEAAERERQQREQQERMRQVDSVYSDVDKLLNQRESNLRGALPDMERQAALPFEQYLPLVQQAGQEGLGRIDLARGDQQVEETNALSAARKLFDELSRRNIQMFGGQALSSTAQAAGELLGRSQQEQFGNIRQESTKAMQGLAEEARRIESQTEAQINQLQLQKEQAVNQARLEFRDRLDAINSDRTIAAQQKAAVKLQELQNFRARVESLEDQARQFSYNIALQRDQAMGAVQQGFSQFQNQVNQGLNNAGNYLNSAYQGYGDAINSGAQANAIGFGGGAGPQLEGNIGLPRREEERRAFA